ncbi:hypothetical protein RRG08_053870 [Elysia crispata]|uniref:Sulfotransferase n=1 Tax=Elysia crispata TaxID=231223 RepID=A0AAE1D120_9GAST|nr:hypothetical protein RRG08_053870 [Elysia crispata]
MTIQLRDYWRTLLCTVMFTFLSILVIVLNTSGKTQQGKVKRSLYQYIYEQLTWRISLEELLSLSCLCTFDSQTYKSLINKHLRLSNSTKEFASCFREEEIGMNHLDCYFRFLQECKNHGMTFVKTIRFPVRWAEDLMVRYPNLKLIYLVRDPRATLYSQAKVFQSFDLSRDATNVSSLHCQWLDKDLKHLRQLRYEFPGRVKVVRYEHGATNPAGYAVEIYDFLDLPVTQELMNFVTSLTSPNSDDARDAQSRSRNGKKSLMKRITNRETERFKLDIKNKSVRKKRNNLSTFVRLNASSNFREDRMEKGSSTGGRLKRKIAEPDPYSTHRDNPVRAMEHWRYEIGIKVARVIDSHCGHLYQQLGYKVASSQRDLENTAEISLVGLPRVVGII